LRRAVTNILIVGVGGQGTLMTSRVLAQAAVDLGYDVKVSEVHGMAQRGGGVVTQVRFGSKVFSPLIQAGEADVILAFEPIEGARWLRYLKPDGVIIVNRTFIDPLPVLSGKAQYPRNITQRIAERADRCHTFDCAGIAQACGDSRAANVVMVGLLARLLTLSKETVERAICEVVPAPTLTVNLEAFARGFALMP
jgi:indolepyruvate ferredoxin oxidoreductase beta subunit